VGRSNPTYRDRLGRIESDWAPYRRALRARDQPHFDRLFDHARAHADAAGYLNHRDPTVPLLVGVLLEHERRLAALAERVDGTATGGPGRNNPDAGDAAGPTGATTSGGHPDSDDSGRRHAVDPAADRHAPSQPGDREPPRPDGPGPEPSPPDGG
jgi:hypothetical protein